MRFIKDIPNEYCQTSLYFFNNKYIIKFEAGLLEQTYKVSELDISNEEMLLASLDDAFYRSVIERFKSMAQDFERIIEYS